MVAAARLQQRQVTVHRGLAFTGRRARYLLHDLRARRETRGVLIHVVRRAEEVRDARPRQTPELVVIDRVAVVRLEEVEVDLAESLRRDGTALFGEAVRLQL